MKYNPVERVSNVFNNNTFIYLLIHLQYTYTLNLNKKYKLTEKNIITRLD